MSESTLYRLGSVGVVLGAVLIALASLVPMPEDLKASAASGMYYLVAIGMLVGAVLLIAGLPALYLRQHRESGVLGLVGFLLMLGPAIVITVGLAFAQTLIFPWMATLPLSASQFGQGPPALGVFFPVATVLVAVGGVLFGIATLRARVFPRWTGISFIALVVISLAANFAGPVEVAAEAVYMVALIAFGVALWLGVGGRVEAGAAGSAAPSTPAVTP